MTDDIVKELRDAAFSIRQMHLLLSDAKILPDRAADAIEDLLVLKGTMIAERSLMVARLEKQQEEIERLPPDIIELANVIAEFRRKLPDWWFTVGSCSVSRDASCGPDLNGRDAYLLLTEDRVFDEGFHHDDPEGNMANSLRIVMEYAIEMKEQYTRKVKGTND